MSYGIPFDFNMPQFVNTRASQRVVVSIHAGGLGVFGGEGAQRSSLSAASVPGTASCSSAAGAPGTCSHGCLGAPASGGAPRALQLWAPREHPAGHSLAAHGMPVHPPAALSLGSLCMGLLLFSSPWGKSCLPLQGVRTFSSLPAWCLQASCRNQGTAGAMQRLGTSLSSCWRLLSGCRLAPRSGAKRRVLVGEELHGQAKNFLGGGFS